MKRCLGRMAQAFACLRRFRADESGNVAIIVGVTIVVLMLSVGAAVDVGRWLHARDRTMSAIDAAVLAGGRTLQLTHGDQTAAVLAATKYYDENVKSRLPIIDDTVKFTVAGDGMGLSASGNAYILTPFLSNTALLGLPPINKLPLISLAETQFDGMGSQIGMKGGETEISVMLDITLSMSGQKLKDLKTAAQKLVDVVTTANKGGKYETKIALVPFSEDVRLPTATAVNTARGSNLTSCKQLKNGVVYSCNTNVSGATKYYLSDYCVVERIGNYKYAEDGPGNGRYVQGHYVTATTGSGNNMKGKCTVPANSAIQPLTSDTTLLKNKINSLSVSGSTAGHLGTAWAWYTLSPEWNDLWSADNRAKPYTPAGSKNDEDQVKKVAILMTDGDYNTQYDANGISANAMQTSNCPQAANGCSTVQALALCQAMKDKGIEVYTVGFDVGKTSLAAQTLKACATDDTKYYNADDGEALNDAFADIAVKLTTVYLSK